MSLFMVQLRWEGSKWDLSAVGSGAVAGEGLPEGGEGDFCQEGAFATFDASHFGKVTADTGSGERAFHVSSDGKKGIPGAA